MNNEKSSKKMMDQATDKASEDLTGTQNIAQVAQQFNEKLDKASALDSAKYQKKQ